MELWKILNSKEGRKKGKLDKKQMRQKISSKIVSLNPIMSIMALNVDVLYAPIKEIVKLDKKTKPSSAASKKCTLNIDTHKNMENMLCEN